MKLGICTAGCEDAFEDQLREAYRFSEGQFTYAEVGIADGTTILSVAEMFEQMIDECRIVGVDIPECGVFTPEVFISSSGGKAEVRREVRPAGSGISVYLLPNGLQEPGRAETIFGNDIDFAFIDGCHGKACATADFLAIENCVKPGGIVCFHDACEEDQGASFQQHCQENINVRQALQDLLLISNERPGWDFIDEVHGNKNLNGNGMCFFRRTQKTL